MKKILVVGYMPYGYMGKLVERYPDVLWVPEQEVGMSDKSRALIELVEMMDGVMFMDNYSDRIGYEVACVMTHKDIYEKEEFSVEEHSVPIGFRQKEEEKQ